MQKLYTVEMVGEVRELYDIWAESEQDAIDRWHEGDLYLSEASSMEFHSVHWHYEEEEDEG